MKRSGSGIPDHLIEDEDDRLYLSSLSELDREKILFEREERLILARQKKELMDRLRDKQGQLGKEYDDEEEHDEDEDEDEDEDGFMDGKEFNDNYDNYDKEGEGESSGGRKKRRKVTKNTLKNDKSKRTNKGDHNLAYDGDDDDDDDGNFSSPPSSSNNRQNRKTRLERLQNQVKSKKNKTKFSSKSTSKDNHDHYDDDDDDENGGEKSSSYTSSSSRESLNSIEDTRRRGYEEGSSRQTGSTVDEITVQDIVAIQVTRSVAERLVYLPIFQDTCPGLFVRIFIGVQKQDDYGDTPIPIYRCCQILGVEGYRRTYKLTDGSPCSLSLKVRFGTSERTFRLDAISNSPCTPTELNRWKTEMLRKSVKPDFPVSPRSWSSSSLKIYQARVETLLSYKVTNQDVNTILAAKIKSGNVPLHEQKADLLSRIALLESECKPSTSAMHMLKYKQQQQQQHQQDGLAELDEARRQLKSLIEQQEFERAHSPAQQNLLKWTELNVRNRIKNAEEIRRAQQKTLSTSIRNVTSLAAVNSAGSDSDGQHPSKKIDVFARRRARNVHSFIQAISERKSATDDKDNDNNAGKPKSNPSISPASETKHINAIKFDDVQVTIKSDNNEKSKSLAEIQNLHQGIDLDLDLTSPIDATTQEL